MRDKVYSLPSDLNLSLKTGTAFPRISPGELKQTHFGGWGERKESAKPDYVEPYWQDIQPTEVWLLSQICWYELDYCCIYSDVWWWLCQGLVLLPFPSFPPPSWGLIR